MKILYATLFLLFPVVGFSQVSIGPLVGINNTRYKYLVNKKHQNPDRNDMVFDYRIGAIANVLLSTHNKLYFQTALLYTSNTEKRVDPWRKQTRIPFNISAIEIPLSLEQRGGKSPAQGWFVSPGMLFGINVRARQTVHYYDTLGNYIGPGKLPIAPIGNEVNGIVPAYLGVRIDAGYHFEGGFSLRGHFQNVLTNLISNPNPPDIRTSRLNYGIAFAYQFQLKNRRKIEALKNRR